MKINPKLRLLLYLLLFGLIFSGCSFIRIQNISEVRVRVLIRVPDNSKGYMRSINPGNITDVFSGHGGRYTVTIVPNEGYVQLMEDVRADISRRLFEERATLSGNDVARLVERLNDIEARLEREMNISVSCSGTVPDFETVVVSIGFDITSQSWHVACQ